MTDFWKRKLLAFLHDPPEKAYDYSPEHGKRAKHYAERIGLNLSEWQDKLADYTAAAADRFIFPSTKRTEDGRWVDTGVPGLGGGLQFIHPLAGGKVDATFPTEDEALGFCRDGFPDFADIDDPQLRFWLIWRLWRHYTVEQPKAKEFALALASLSADTRIPDGTIWHHDAVVSALEAARDAEGCFAPAFLLFQVGPVQEFIAQARSTRDAWSGSYLISWMMAHAMKLLAEKLGPDCVIYPSLRGQPLYDWLEQEKLKRAFHTSTDGTKSKSFWEVAEYEKRFGQELALTPNLPNRFLAVVPTGFDAKQLETVFSADGWNSKKPDAELPEWARIARACWRFLPKVGMPESAEKLWDFQVRHFWQVTWQLWPWQEVKPTMDLFKTIPLGKRSSLHLGREVALAIPDLHKDTRCYATGRAEIENRGWAWSAHYQLLAHRLDARRQTRDFYAWQPSAKPGHKDHFSGKEDVIATSDWLKAVRENGVLRHLFRHDDELGAVNLIKRVWHKAYLEKEREFKREAFKFDSVLSIAAAPWREKVLGKLGNDEGAWSALLGFQEAVSASASILDFELPVASNESEWLTRVDASVFHDSFWNNLDLTGAEEEQLRDAGLASLRALLKAAKTGQPGKYFAVAALDGDQIGKWLSGEKTPTIQEAITDKAAKYFREHIKGKDVEAWLKTNRPLSPSYHLQFSEALANFGLYCARRIVEAHHGQLIYSGGDDLLAMLPADEAIACAQGLRLAFQGSSKLAEAYPAHFTKTSEGFIQLAERNDSNQGDWNRGCRRPGEPAWPLLVPGPQATVSVGLAIGHIKEPLQDMIREAQAAEKRAKNKLGRNALSVTLFKRSGELIEWGTSFESPKNLVAGGDPTSASLRLLEFIQSDNRYRKPLDQPDYELPVSGKFPYRLTELLERYQDFERHNQYPDYSSPLPLTPALRQIAEREIAWVVARQCDRLPERDQETLLALCSATLRELEHLQRPLSDFYHLFALEAFIARQGE